MKTTARNWISDLLHEQTGSRASPQAAARSRQAKGPGEDWGRKPAPLTLTDQPDACGRRAGDAFTPARLPRGERGEVQRGSAPLVKPCQGREATGATGAYSLAGELVSILAIHNNYFK